MTRDDSFKKQGAVPFKWEIRPGVPKVQPPPPSYTNLHRSLGHHHQQKQQSNDHHRSCPSTPLKLRPPPAGISFHPLELHTRFPPHTRPGRFDHHRSCPSTPPKLRPSPAGFSFHPPSPDLRARSFRSAPRTQSGRCPFNPSGVTRLESVSVGCFPGPLTKRNGDRKRSRRPKPEPNRKTDYIDLEILAMWSGSTVDSLSPSSPSFSSYQLSPRPVDGTDRVHQL
ncbi:hypothetical protein U1Q18_037163 [Sarracenia purpurea var. burkii]